MRSGLYSAGSEWAAGGRASRTVSLVQISSNQIVNRGVLRLSPCNVRCMYLTLGARVAPRKWFMLVVCSCSLLAYHTSVNHMQVILPVVYEEIADTRLCIERIWHLKSFSCCAVLCIALLMILFVLFETCNYSGLCDWWEPAWKDQWVELNILWSLKYQHQHASARCWLPWFSRWQPAQGFFFR